MKRISFKANILSFIFIVSLFGLNNAFSQWYYSFSLDGEYNSNPFRLPEAEADQTSQIAFGIQRDWSNVSAQYYGSLANFNQNEERNFYWQQFFIGGGEKTNWNLSIDNRINRQEYNVYDYSNARGGVTQQVSIGKFLGRLAAGATINYFPQFSDLNNVLLNGTVSLNRSFQTKTTFIGALGLNYKTYLNQNPVVAAVADTATDISASIRTVDVLGNGPGGPGTGTGGGGMGGAMGSGTYATYYAADSESPSVAQFLLSLRVAQSVTKYTGIALQYYNRINLTNQDRGVVGLLYGYSEESQIFDDPMGYEGQTFGAELTQLFPYQISLKSSFYRQQKNYVSQGLYSDPESYDDTVLRQDTRQSVWVSLQKQWGVNFLGGASITWQVNYQWIDNQSNSYWYNYNNHYASSGLQFDF